MKILHLIFLILIISIVFCQENELKIRGNSAIARISNSYGSPIFAAFRKVLWRATGRIKDLEEENRKDGKTQDVFFKLRPEYANKFPCNPNGPGKRSETSPTNVYEIRPGDIDIIAAIGDSLSSGNGAYSNQILHIANEFRSIAWSGGGKGSYNNYITLPNILKLYNPNLYGYSVSDGLTIDEGSRLNIAEPMVMSPDLVFQAKTLINRMMKDPKVNIQKHWKMLTIFVGNNDFCSDSCHYKSFEDWVNLHEIELIKALRIIRDKIPKLIVNLIGLPNYTVMFRTKNSPLRCYAIYRVGCHCLFKPDMNESKLNLIKKGIDLWNSRDEQIAKMKEFHTNDFTVIYQPFFTNVTFFTNEKRGEADFSYMANDCFHLSQLGHAMASIGLWQNLMEPYNNKMTYWNPNLMKFLNIKCPKSEKPFIQV